MRVSAIIVAGGKGERLGGAVPKQFLEVGGRSLLQRSVYPEDIAEGVYFFASDLSNKSTGNFLNVDAGNAASFTR